MCDMICYLGHRQFSEHQPQTAYRYTTFKLQKSRSNRVSDSEFLHECKAKFFSGCAFSDEMAARDSSFAGSRPPFAFGIEFL